MRLLDKENVARPLPESLKAGDEPLFSHEYHREIPAVDLVEVKNAEVLPNGFVHVGGRLLPQVFLGPPKGLRALKAWLRMRQYHVCARAVRVERALFVTDDWSNGFFHWVGEVLPRLEVLGSTEAEGRTLLVPAMADFEYAHQSLAAYRLPDIRFLAWSERVSCRDLLVVPPVAPTGNYRPAVMSALRDRMRRFFGARPASRRLYISRAGAAARRIANESDVLPLLERHGFERVLAERLSLSEQVRLVGSASILIGTTERDSRMRAGCFRARTSSSCAGRGIVPTTATTLLQALWGSGTTTSRARQPMSARPPTTRISWWTLSGWRPSLQAWPTDELRD